MLTPIDPFQYVESSARVRRPPVRPCGDRRKENEAPSDRQRRSLAFRLLATLCAIGLALIVWRLVLTIPW